MNNNYKLSSKQITLITAVPALLITASCGSSLITRIVLDVIIAAAGYAAERTLKKNTYQAVAHGILLGAAIAAGYSLFRLVINLTKSSDLHCSSLHLSSSYDTERPASLSSNRYK